jgi:hypothetical protein
LLLLPIQSTHKPESEIVNEFILRYSAVARLRQVRLPFSYRTEWDGFRKGVDLTENHLFLEPSENKKKDQFSTRILL